MLFRSVLDLLDWVRVVQYPAEERAVPENGIERKVYDMLHQEPMQVNELSRQLGLPVEQLTSALTMMELKGLVRSLGAMVYAAV